MYILSFIYTLIAFLNWSRWFYNRIYQGQFYCNKLILFLNTEQIISICDDRFQFLSSRLKIKDVSNQIKKICFLRFVQSRNESDEARILASNRKADELGCKNCVDTIKQGSATLNDNSH